MPKFRIVIVVSLAALALILSGCPRTTPRVDPMPTDLTVMTYNVYIGTALAGLFAVSDPAQLPATLGQLYANVVASDVPGRAAAIAKAVKEAQPHLIGLQEVFEIRYLEDEFSFRAILMAAFKAAGLDYRVVAEVKNADISVSLPTGLNAGLTDFDLILARSDVDAQRPTSANYEARLPLQVAGIPLGDMLRGYAAIDATVAGVTYRVVNTHLEATLDAAPPRLQQASQQLRLAQARELVASLQAETLPVILLGDFNTPATDGMAYRLLIEAGYEDAWQTASMGSGNTCCQAANLQNEMSELSKRIDQIFIKGVSLRQGDPIRTATVGDTPADKTANGLWPSDHAGVVAHLPVE